MAGYVMRQFTRPKAVTHPSTNRARCRATALIETNALPLHQTANPTYLLTYLQYNECVLCFQFPVFRNESVLHQQTLAVDVRTVDSCCTGRKSNKEEKLEWQSVDCTPLTTGKKINNSQHAHLIIPVLIWTVNVSEEHSGHTPNVNHLAIFFRNAVHYKIH